MFYVIILLFIFAPNASFSKNQDKFFSIENFNSKLKNDFNYYELYSTNPNLFQNIITIWDEKLSILDKDKTVEFLNVILSENDQTSKLKYLSFLLYLNRIYYDHIVLSSSLFQLLVYHQLQAKLQNTTLLKEINNIIQFVESKAFSFSQSKQITFSKGTMFFNVKEVEEKDTFFFQEDVPEETDFVIDLKNVDLHFFTENDSFTIKKTSLKYLFNRNQIDGKSGVLNFNKELNFIGNPIVTFITYTLDQQKGSLFSSSSILETKLTQKIEGLFNYNSSRVKNKHHKNYFVFTSHSNDINIPINKKTRLISGINIQGNLLSTKSSMNSKSRIKILLSKGNYIEASSSNFLLETDNITSDNSRFILYHNSDSLYHESVRLQYSLFNQHLKLFRSKGSLKNTSYFSSFFDVSINADMLDWKLQENELMLKNISAANERPVIIESADYFSRQRLQQLTDMKGINILKIIVNYSNLKKQNEFYLDDVASHYKTKSSSLKSGLIKLWQNGFVSYDPLVGFIKLNYKIKHYYYSQINKRDYDQILFNSISPRSQNITFNLENLFITINGVRDIILSEENNITIFPENETIKLLSNRGINCVGDITVGNFDFQGADMSFDYNKFVLKLDRIDTLRIKSRSTIDTIFVTPVSLNDSLQILDQDISKEENRTADLYNYLYSIDGAIFINHPKNKSARRNLPNYPYFISDQGTGVYFDLPQDYGAQYDSTFYFTINQFRIDSLDKPQLPLFEFDGIFYSNNIFSPINAKLITMPDKSLGFVKEIPEEGIFAYDKQMKVFNKLQMDSKGLSGEGYLHYLTTKLYYDDIKFFPDSAKAFIDKGYMLEGYTDNKIGSFPDMTISNMNMVFHYAQQKDSIHLNYKKGENNILPIITYEDKGLLTGDLVISKDGVVSSGVLEIEGSQISSEFFNFKQTKFSSIHSDFLLFSENKTKPVISGEALNIDFDLEKKEVKLKPEYEGFASFAFPYSEIKTSISEASWDLQNQLFLMEKNLDDDISDSYFYSTKKELDSLYFLGEKAIYNIPSKELNVFGIPYIDVADSYIIPDQGHITILENSKIAKLLNAEIVLDTTKERHHFYNSTVNILSRNKFSAEGIYNYVNFHKDTFNITFNSFEVVNKIKDLNTSFTTLSSGEVTDNALILIEPGFHYKGTVQLYADSKDLFFDGHVSPSITEGIKNRSWIEYNEKFIPGDDFRLALNNSQNSPSTILYNTNKNQEMSFAFFDSNERKNADPIFVAEGDIFYDLVLQQYIIEPIEKSNNIKYSGKSFAYNPLEKTIYFEGETNLYNNNRNVQIASTSTGSWHLDSMNIQTQTFMTLDINLKPSIKTNLATNFVDIIEQIGAPVAHANEEEVLTSLGALIGGEKMKKFEDEFLMTGYSPLHLAAEELIKLFVFSNIDLKWSQENKSWYNVSKLNLANIGEYEINARLNGFLEIKKVRSGDYILSLFIQPAPDYWCFFKYENRELIVLSSFEEFNREVFEIRKSQKDRYLWPDYGDEKSTLDFINNFRYKYFGIEESYNFSSPSSTFSEDEVFKTISDDDDGF